MENFIFRFPLKLEDLQSSANGANSYRVLNAYGPREVIQLCSDLSDTFNGPEFILDNFDVIFHFLTNFDKINAQHKDVVWKLMMKVMFHLHSHLNDLLANADAHEIVDLIERRKKCNMLKMITYLFTQMMLFFEEASRKDSEVIDDKGRKKVKLVECQYERDKEKAVRSLTMLFSLPLHWVFEPQIVEEDFVSCITKLCWKLLENPTMPKNKTMMNNVFSILGTSVEKHRQHLSFSLNLIQLLRLRETFVNLAFGLTEHVVKQNNQGEIIAEIVRNICDLDRSELTRDTPGTRAIAQFLIDLAGKCCEYFVEIIPLLCSLLDDEPYGFRNAVMNIFGILIIEHFSNADMEEEQIAKRNELFDMLEEHLLDANTFSRGRAIQVFTKLCQQGKIPLSRLHRLVSLIVQRLLDKSSYVRKQAIIFLNEFITVCPFALKVPLSALREQLEKEDNRLKNALKKIEEEKNISQDGKKNQELEDEEKEAQDEEQDVEMDDEEENEQSPEKEQDKTLIGQVEPMETGIDELNEKNLDPVQDVEKQKVLVKYLGDCVKFAEQIQIAIPRVSSMLYSRIIADIQESIDFFVVASKYEVDGALYGVRKLISLIFSHEKAVQDSILKAFTDIYINSLNFAQLSPRAKAKEVVACLTELVKGATAGEIVSLEEVMSKLMASNQIDQSYVQVMWERFTMKQINTSEEESRIAVRLVSMIANANADIIRDNLDLLISTGLGERAEKDLELATNTLIAIRKAQRGRGKVDTIEEVYRLPSEHELFVRIHYLIMLHIKDQNSHWLPFTNEAIKVIFLFGQQSNALSERLIRDCAKLSIKEAQEYLETVTDEVGSQFNSQNSQTNRKDIKKFLVNSHLLANLMFILGETAFNELLHIELDIATEIKVRNMLKHNQEENKHRIKATSKTPRRKSVAPKTPGENLDEEIGLAGAQADDDTDFLQLICNEEIVMKFKKQDNLLSRMAGIIVEIATDPVTYSNVALQRSTALALSKYMLVSEKFCREHIRLFFTILELSSEPSIKINSIIACGDLCVRFPNLLDPWTPQLYNALRSKCLQVRATTFKVVSRLILSDMIKIKEQISEVAKIIVDEDSALSQMAVYFFSELAKKNNNAIYNILPDVISHLSNINVGIREPDFHIVVKNLIELIDKEKQILCLIDKLCQRFKIVDQEREYRDLSYCLSLMKMSDRCVPKLLENFSCFSDKLMFEQVYNNFCTVMTNCRKVMALKNENKQLLDDMQQKIERIRQKGIDDSENAEEGIEEVSQSAKKVSTLSRKNPTSSKKAPISAKKKAKSKKKLFSGDQSDDEVENYAKSNKSSFERPTRASQRTRTRANPIVEEEEEEEDDN